jgi:hypothetical protein
MAPRRVRFSVSHSEVDNSGYDLIIEARGIMRHVQLKAMHGQARRRSFDIQTRLGAKPNGCAVLIRHDARSLAVEAYRWFGGPPGQGLPPLGRRSPAMPRAMRSAIRRTGRRCARCHSRALRPSAISRRWWF